MKNTTIKKKLFWLLVGLTALLAIIFVTVNLISSYLVKNEIQSRNEDLGSTVANESSQALLNKTIDQMTITSEGVAEYSNQRFYQVESQLKVLAAQLESIYDNDSGVYSSDVTSPYGLLSQEEYDANLAEDPRSPLIHVKAESRAWDSKTGSLTDAAQAELNLISPLAPAMAQTVSANDIITACYIGSTAGIQLSADSSTSQTSVEVTDFCGEGGMASRSWYQTAAALEDGEVAWTPIFQDVSGRGASLTCVTPIYDKTGTMRAVLVCASVMANYSKRITQTTIGKTGQSFIIDSDGDIIISADDITFVDGEPQYEKLSDSGDDAIKEAEAKIMAGENGYAMGEYDGRQVLLTYTKIAAQPWSFVTLIDMDEVMATSDQITSSINTHTENTIEALRNSLGTVIIVMVVVIVLSLLLVLFISTRFASKLTKPLLALTEGAKTIGSGNLDTVIEVDSNDETKLLADAFNGMTVDLKEHIADLAKITAEKERIGAELNVATRIQASMLPCIFPPYPDRDEFDIYATMTPAKEVGGDFYDFFLIDDDHLALVMADVSGKGVPAALFMVITKTLLKNSAQSGLDVAQVLEKVNDQLCENNEAGMFVTVWMGVLQISTGRIRCANAGHEYPAIRRKDGRFELLQDKHGFVLAGLEGSHYTDYEMDLHAGDTLFVYTDGVPEATNAHNELMGNDRMLEALNADPDAAPAELLPQVKRGIDAFVGDAPQFDDITMLALHLKYTTADDAGAGSTEGSTENGAENSTETGTADTTGGRA